MPATVLAMMMSGRPALQFDNVDAEIYGLDRGCQDHLAGVNRVQNVDIPVGERLWGAGRTLSIGVFIDF